MFLVSRQTQAFPLNNCHFSEQSLHFSQFPAGEEVRDQEQGLGFTSCALRAWAALCSKPWGPTRPHISRDRHGPQSIGGQGAVINHVTGQREKIINFTAGTTVRSTK